MTNSEIENRQAVELVARRDLQDIRALKESQPFNRYWLRRLEAKRDDVAERFHNDPPAKCDKDEREILRRLLAAYNELVGLLDKEQGEIQAQLERQA